MTRNRTVFLALVSVATLAGAGAFALAVKSVNGMMMAHDGPIKTFPLRGIKNSPPYLHDGRSPTLEDAVEYFNLIQRLHLTAQEKKDLVAFLLCL